MSKTSKKKINEMELQTVDRETRPTRSTIAEYDTRIKTITDLLLSGSNRLDIIQFTSEKWGVSERTSDEMIARARKKIVDLNSDSIEESIALITANYWDIVKKTKSKEDYNTSVMALREIAKLKGLDQITINHVHHKSEDYSDIDDDDAIEAELVKK